MNLVNNSSSDKYLLNLFDLDAITSMGRNIELKVTVNSLQNVEKLLREKFRKEDPEILKQKDIFFSVNGRENERLKLRYCNEV